MNRINTIGELRAVLSGLPDDATIRPAIPLHSAKPGLYVIRYAPGTCNPAFVEVFIEPAAAGVNASPAPVADAETKAAYVAAFGSDKGWLGIEGSYFIEGYRSALCAGVACKNGCARAAGVRGWTQEPVYTAGVGACDERQQFEAWMRREHPKHSLERTTYAGDHGVGDYVEGRTHEKWQTWQAALSRGVPAAVHAAPPSVASSNTESVVFKCDNPGGCRFPKQPCLASCSLTVNLAPTSGVASARGGEQ